MSWPTTKRRVRDCAHKSLVHRARIYFSWRTCSASATPWSRPPTIAPDARRRRLTALVNGASLARSTPAVYVIEDAHWIDQVSESMVADFLPVIPRTHSLVLVTYRPDYCGALCTTPGAQMITLAPLNDSESAALIGELLGPDTSAAGLTGQIAER